MKPHRINIYLIIINIFFLINIITNCSCSRKKAFSTEEWKMKPRNRIDMIDYLFDKKILNNKSEKEIFNLLGYPESSDTTNSRDNYLDYIFRDDSLNKDTDIIYILGGKPGFYQKTQFLIISFKNDTVFKYKLYY